MQTEAWIRPSGIAGVVADTFKFKGVYRLVFQQNGYGVGELDFAECAGFGRRQGFKDSGCKDVTSDDAQVGGGVLGARLFN